MVTVFTAQALNAKWVLPLPFSSTAPKSPWDGGSKSGAARLSHGAWASIGVACAVVLAALFGAGVYIAKRRKRKGAKPVSTADCHTGVKLEGL